MHYSILFVLRAPDDAYVCIHAAALSDLEKAEQLPLTACLSPKLSSSDIVNEADRTPLPESIKQVSQEIDSVLHFALIAWRHEQVRWPVCKRSSVWGLFQITCGSLVQVVQSRSPVKEVYPSRIYGQKRKPANNRPEQSLPEQAELDRLQFGTDCIKEESFDADYRKLIRQKCQLYNFNKNDQTKIPISNLQFTTKTTNRNFREM